MVFFVAPAMRSNPNQKLDLTAHSLYYTQYVHHQPNEDPVTMIQMRMPISLAC